MTNLFLHIIAVINRGLFHMVPDSDYSAPRSEVSMIGRVAFWIHRNAGMPMPRPKQR